jgi:Fe2+ or Zn2+ uptake regulation protein
MDIDMPGEFFDNAVISQMNGIEIVSHDITFYGYCEQCGHGVN